MKDYSTMTLSEVRHYVDLCKRGTRDEAEIMQKYLLQRALATGATSSEILEAIQSISDRFVLEDRELRKKAIEEDLRRRGVMNLEPIDADDYQIIKAIKKTLHQFQSSRDWGGVYRILVDFCAFPPNYSDFVRRFDTMGIYPSDDIVKGVKRMGIPSISEREFNNNRFNYQALQKGIQSDWPQTYIGWMNCHITDNDFICRRNIATSFYKNLMAEVG